MYIVEEVEVFIEKMVLISSLWYKNHLICLQKARFEEIVIIEYIKIYLNQDKTIKVVENHFNILNY